MKLSRVLANVFSPGGTRGVLSILIFHRVLQRQDPLFPDEVDAARFDQLLNWVGTCFSVVPLDHAVEGLKVGRLPPRALSITFDDGYADNYTVALPILQKHGMSATFFIASDFLDGGRMWNDTVIESVRGSPSDELDLRVVGLGQYRIGSVEERRSAIDRILPQIKYLALSSRAETVSALANICGAQLSNDLMMTSVQLRALRAAGMVVGGHTRRHPILARLDDSAAFDEIVGGKADLESILGERLSLFAYPNGKPGKDYLARHVDMVRRAGYCCAVTTSSGVSRCGADVFQLPRFTPWDRTPLRFNLRLIDNMRSAGKVARA